MAEILHAKEIVERALTNAIGGNAPRADVMALAGPVGTINWLLGRPEGEPMQEMIDRVDSHDNEVNKDSN